MAKLEALRRGETERGGSRGRLSQELRVKGRERRQRMSKYITQDERKKNFGDENGADKKKDEH